MLAMQLKTVKVNSETSSNRTNELQTQYAELKRNYEAKILEIEEKDKVLEEYRKAETEDAEMLVNIYNASFYSDYRRFGACPGYGKTIEMMEASIRDNPKYIILCDNKPVGCVSCKMQEMRVYEITCLCIVPEYQGKGIGTALLETLCEESEKAGYWSLYSAILSNNKSSIALHQKCGFREIGYRERIAKDRFGNWQNTTIMERRSEKI